MMAPTMAPTELSHVAAVRGTPAVLRLVLPHRVTPRVSAASSQAQSRLSFSASFYLRLLVILLTLAPHTTRLTFGWLPVGSASIFASSRCEPAHRVTVRSPFAIAPLPVDSALSFCTREQRWLPSQRPMTAVAMANGGGGVPTDVMQAVQAAGQEQIFEGWDSLTRGQQELLLKDVQVAARTHGHRPLESCRWSRFCPAQDASARWKSIAERSSCSSYCLMRVHNLPMCRMRVNNLLTA